MERIRSAQPWRRDALAVAGLAAVAVALAARFWAVGGASWTYNEATYVEMARHPWWSSFYPDTLFVRHPPLWFALLWAWVSAFGAGEAVVRTLALFLTLGGAALLWDACGRLGGRTAAVLAALVLAAAFPLHAYALNASMYPLAFLFAAAAVWAHAHGRWRLEGAALTAFALTHLFGFLFLALWLWRHRRDGLRVAVVAWPAAAWLVLAAAAALAVNTQGDVMRLGPLGQAARGGATAGKAVAVTPWVHLASAALAWWILNPVLLAGAWTVRRRFAVWSPGVGLLVVYFFFGAPFPRYALLVLPFVVAMGVAAWARYGGDPAGTGPARAAPSGDVPDSWTAAGPRRRVLWLGALAAVALLSLPAGFAYLSHGPDTRAAGDVPGVQEWRPAVAALPPGTAAVATSGPTATAYYLQEAGWQVSDRSEAPYRIALVQAKDPAASIQVWRVDAAAQVAGVEADAWILPDHWPGADAAVAEQGGALCAEVTGLRVYAVAC